MKYLDFRIDIYNVIDVMTTISDRKLLLQIRIENYYFHEQNI